MMSSVAIFLSIFLSTASTSALVYPRTSRASLASAALPCAVGAPDIAGSDKPSSGIALESLSFNSRMMRSAVLFPIPGADERALISPVETAIAKGESS